jgi:cytochrome c-type biogenesis protein CcmH
MTTFWLAASGLTAVALGFLLLPLWRQHRQTGRWSVSGISAALLTVPIAVPLYFTVTTYQPGVLEQRAEQMQLVDQLAARLRQQPDDVQGWRLLGRSYLVLGLYDQARGALREAWERTPDPNRDDSLKLDYAEAEILADRSTLGGEAGQLVEEVLTAEPGNPKALWYGGQRALGLGQNDVVRERLTRLLSLGAPEEIAQIVRSQLAQLPGASGGGVPEGGPQQSAAATGPSVRITVRLGDEFSAADLAADSSLFIFARAPQGGPPVAVMRQPASAVPGEFVLSDANSMIPGRSLEDFEELELIARISTSGQSQEQPGDLYAELPFHPGKDQTAELVIDKVVQ